MNSNTQQSLSQSDNPRVKSFSRLPIGHYFYFANDSFVPMQADRNLPNAYQKVSFHRIKQYAALKPFVFKKGAELVEDAGCELPMTAPPFPGE